MTKKLDISKLIGVHEYSIHVYQMSDFTIGLFSFLAATIMFFMGQTNLFLLLRSFFIWAISYKLVNCLTRIRSYHTVKISKDGISMFKGDKETKYEITEIEILDYDTIVGNLRDIGLRMIHFKHGDTGISIIISDPENSIDNLN